jgi:shikimate kinase
VKKIYILIGAKGSGKSYIGRLIEERLKIKFLLIEKLFMKIKGSRDVLDKKYLIEGYDAVEKAIDKHLTKNDAIIFESTGAFYYFNTFLKSLQSKYVVKLIFIHAPFELCIKRIHQRDQRKHLKMSERLIKKVYNKSNTLKYKYVLKINNAVQSDDNIIKSFKQIL